MIRRKYIEGHRCGDCGRTRRTTIITWWVSGFQMRVCSDCIRAYRADILKPCHCSDCANGKAPMA